MQTVVVLFDADDILAWILRHVRRSVVGCSATEFEATDLGSSESRQTVGWRLGTLRAEPPSIFLEKSRKIEGGSARRVAPGKVMLARSKKFEKLLSKLSVSNQFLSF